MTDADAALEEGVAELFRKAEEVIDKLISRDELQTGAAAMPSRELFFASGIAFFFLKKVGVGITGGSGQGFILSKVIDKHATDNPAITSADAQASAKWSAPLFLKVKAGGIGISVGYTTISSCVIVDSPEEVKKFAGSRLGVGGCITGALGESAGAHLSFGHNENKTFFSYNLVNGVIANMLSVEGLRTFVDTKSMESVYGAGWTAEDVLSGSVSPPPGSEGLLNTLKEKQKLYTVELREAARTRAAGPPADA
uniref:Ysc84 actin-binding domain-containing protein n=1 Tax=Auxenochlorella protothecoides TaxID=3075 RepID=A0A1D2A6F9_AUXPR